MSLAIADPAGNTCITIWIRDMDDDDTAELWVRDPGITKIGDLTGFTFSGEGAAGDSTLFTAPVVHQFIIDGHFDQPVPTFDFTCAKDGSVLAAFTGLTHWQDHRALV